MPELQQTPERILLETRIKSLVEDLRALGRDIHNNTKEESKDLGTPAALMVVGNMIRVFDLSASSYAFLDYIHDAINYWEDQQAANLLFHLNSSCVCESCSVPECASRTQPYQESAAN